MDARFVNPFVVSVKQVFKTMADADVQILKPKMKSDESSDVSGIIGFSGDAMGAVVLCFPGDVACKLASAFSGEEMTIDHVDFADAIGELANMVAGGAKALFKDLTVNISLPSVAIGKSHLIGVAALPADTPRLVIPCQTEMGTFHLEVAMIVNQKSGNNTPQAAQAAGAST